MNKEQKQLLKNELNALEKENKTAIITQIIWAVIMFIILFIFWPLTIILLISTLIYYTLTIRSRNHRIKDLQYKLAGEKNEK